MTSHRFSTTAALAALLVTGSFLISGCRTIHEVKIDAISDPSKPVGQMSRLEIRPGPQADEAVLRQVAAHVEHALSLNGIAIAPEGTKPDVLIRVEAGVGPAQRKFVYDATVEPKHRVSRKDRRMIYVHEKYIRLSAREPDQGPTAARTEIWSVNVAVEDESVELSPYLPALTAALIDHIGDDASEEKILRIPQTQAQKAVGLVPSN
jgi:hypothetical protein